MGENLRVRKSQFLGCRGEATLPHLAVVLAVVLIASVFVGLALAHVMTFIAEALASLTVGFEP